MALQFFGFTLARTEQPGKDRDLLKKKNEAEQPASFVPPTSDDGSTAIAAGGYYGQYLDLEGDAAKTDVDLIRKYRISAEQPECDMAIEDIVNESIVHDEHEKPIDINLDDLEVQTSIKKEIKAEFDRICQLLNFNVNGQDIFRRWYVDGRLYFHIIINEENRDEGILELRAVDALRIRKVREIKEETDSLTGAKIIKTLDEYYLYQDGGLQKSDVGLKINKDAVCYVPSGILDASRKRVLSPLHKALKPVNQLRMMEDALVIYRLSRAPERRIFYIDVGNLPKGKAEEYMRHIMNQYRNKLVYDAATGEIRDDRKHMSMLEDFWLPRREGGRGTEITTLPGGENLSQIEDIIFFQKKLYRALNVPVNRMEPETGFNLGKSSEITRDEVKFQKFVDKLRKKFSALFFELLRVQLILKGVITEEDWPELKENIRFDFRADNFFTELKESEILAGRIDILNSITPYVGTYFSQNWVRRHVLHMTDEDIEDMAEQMDEDAEIQAEQMMQNPQLDKQSGVEDISANETFDRST
jgi:hypothetical protein